VRRLLLALQFLTVIPVRVSGQVSGRDLGGSMLCFPLVGALLGAAAAGTYVLLSHFLLLPELAASTVAVLLLAALTGGLHLDGLADTFDGMRAGRSRERMLEIMRDSRVGVMGAAAVSGDLLLKCALLAAIPREAAPWVLVAAPALSRWGLVLGARRSRPAREDGLGRDFLAGVGRAELLAATALAAALGVGLLDWTGLIACLAVVPVAWGWTRHVEHRIGGVTGDTFGALNEMLEVLVLLVAACRLGPAG